MFVTIEVVRDEIEVTKKAGEEVVEGESGRPRIQRVG